MRDIDGALRRASRAFSPHRVDEVYVNVSTALFIEAEDLRFGALEFFRVLDPRGRVVLYYSCKPTSSSDASSPLSVFDGAFIVAMDVSEQGDLVDIEFRFRQWLPNSGVRHGSLGDVEPISGGCGSSWSLNGGSLMALADGCR